jgi:hypothetical protein
VARVLMSMSQRNGYQQNSHRNDESHYFLS